MVRTNSRNTTFRENPKNDDIVFTPSNIAQICFKCTYPNCKGICEKYKQQIKLLKK